MAMHLPLRDDKYRINPQSCPAGVEVLMLNHIKQGYSFTCGARYLVQSWADQNTLIVKDNNGVFVELSARRFVPVEQ